MPRALWKGSLAFGLVNIPVELHTAVRSHLPKFRLLHRADSAPIEYQRVCRRDGKPVAWQDLVKGYEYEKGQFVVLTKEDFETAAVEKTRTAEIIDFVDRNAIDDRFFETPYYVTPTRGSERAYAVLREALREAGKVGVARVFLREIQHLSVVEVVGPILVLTLMRFADELVSPETFSLPDTPRASAKELELARMLVENLSSEWRPDKYKDEYRENLMRVIRAKMKGKRVKLEPAATQTDTKVVDLMSRLRESLERAKAMPGKATKKPRGAKRGPAAGTRRRSKHAA
jgi:DNA end-binding protein Ku